MLIPRERQGVRSCQTSRALPEAVTSSPCAGPQVLKSHVRTGVPKGSPHALSPESSKLRLRGLVAARRARFRWPEIRAQLPPPPPVSSSALKAGTLREAEQSLNGNASVRWAFPSCPQLEVGARRGPRAPGGSGAT